MKNKSLSFLFAFLFIFSFFFLAKGAFAHCDTMDGPVITVAEAALEKNDPKLILIWVKKDVESEISDLFKKVQIVRKFSPEAKSLADMYFFETLVRVHRAGEGAPYTGLKPAGTDIGEVIPAIDLAFETGSPESFLKFLPANIHNAARGHFATVFAKKNHNKDDIEAGREYVDNYVGFMHHVLALSGQSESGEDIGSHDHGNKVAASGMNEGAKQICSGNNNGEGEGLKEEIRILKASLVAAWSISSLLFLGLIGIALVFKFKK